MKIFQTHRLKIILYKNANFHSKHSIYSVINLITIKTQTRIFKELKLSNKSHTEEQMAKK